MAGSDLQQGDVEALEQGQRVTKKQTQPPAAAGPPRRSPASGQPAGGTPDPIAFASKKFGGSLGGAPQAGINYDPELQRWLGMAQALAASPGSSGMLVSSFIHQVRQLRQVAFTPMARLVDLNAMDDSIGVMLDAAAQGD